MTAAWVSRSAQIRSKSAASTHTPSHFAHSRRGAPPTVTLSIPTPQAGHFMEVLPAAARSRLAPHVWQYAAVSNINAKQEGQLIVANRARQYGHRRTSGATLAPHAGQRSVPASK